MGGLQGIAIIDKIAEHPRRGELLDFAPDLVVGSPVDEGMMTSWDGTHSIAAEDVRDLLCGRAITDPDPRGLRLRAAHIRGRLDLDNLNTTVKPGTPTSNPRILGPLSWSFVDSADYPRLSRLQTLVVCGYLALSEGVLWP